MRVILNDVRLLYGNSLFESRRGPNGEGEAKYSATVGFSPTHAAHELVKAAFQKVAEEKWGAKAGEVYLTLKAGNKLCLHDGDAKADKEGYKGNLYLTASNKTPPLIIDGGKNVLKVSSGKPYSGCYVNLAIDLWAQDNNFGRRINASLAGVQFVRDGQRLAGAGIASADDFEAIPEAAMATGATPAASSSNPFA